MVCPFQFPPPTVELKIIEHEKQNQTKQNKKTKHGTKCFERARSEYLTLVLLFYFYKQIFVDRI